MFEKITDSFYCGSVNMAINKLDRKLAENLYDYRLTMKNRENMRYLEKKKFKLTEEQLLLFDDLFTVLKSKEPLLTGFWNAFDITAA